MGDSGEPLKREETVRRDQSVGRTRNTATPQNAMSSEEIAAFLARTLVARLGTIRPDGWIHLTPIWYMYERGLVQFCLGKERLHLSNLRRDTRATLLVDEDCRPGKGWHEPVHSVMLAGEVGISDEPKATERGRRRLLARYLGADGVKRAAATRPAEDSQSAFVLVTLAPTRTLTWDFSKRAD